MKADFIDSFFSDLNSSPFLQFISAENCSFRLAFNFYNVDGTVRQHRVFYENPKEGENRYFLNFSPNENDTLFVVSVQNKPNFLVAYPDHVYENFFRYIRTAYSKLNSEGKSDWKSNYRTYKNIKMANVFRSFYSQNEIRLILLTFFSPDLSSISNFHDAFYWGKMFGCIKCLSQLAPSCYRFERGYFINSYCDEQNGMIFLTSSKQVY